MRQIRHGVFETNSSSSHSISIGTQPRTQTLRVVDGVVTIEDGEYGWGVDYYYDAYTKASYCLTHITNHLDVDKPDEVAQALKSPQAEMLRRVIMDHTGAKEVKFQLMGGYIDHQSVGVANEAFENDDTLAQFIFARDSELVISNDNI